MNHDDMKFWVEALLVALLGCLILQTIDAWFTPSEPLQVQGYEYPLSPLLKQIACQMDRDCRALAENLVYEARSESDEGAIAVAYVVLQRAQAKRWPDTIPEVIHYRCHFSWTCQKPQLIVRRKDWTRAYELSYNVLHGLVENPFPGADHYYNPRKVKSPPKWARIYTLIGIADRHRFYKSKEGV